MHAVLKRWGCGREIFLSIIVWGSTVFVVVSLTILTQRTLLDASRILEDLAVFEGQILDQSFARDVEVAYTALLFLKGHGLYLLMTVAALSAWLRLRCPSVGRWIEPLACTVILVSVTAIAAWGIHVARLANSFVASAICAGFETRLTEDERQDVLVRQLNALRKLEYYPDGTTGYPTPSPAAEPAPTKPIGLKDTNNPAQAQDPRAMEPDERRSDENANEK